MRGLFVALLVSIFALSLTVTPAHAAGNPRYAALVLDADTGQMMFESHAREKRYPASLTKMMTLYMVFEALEKGTWKLDTKLTASRKAASQPQTNIFLKPGDTLTVEQAIKALVTRSANDVAVVLAESLGKTDWNFGVMMTSKARALGMRNTVFRNPHGLPDSRQYTTAYDMALLGIALRRDFPQYFSYFTTRSFTYKGRTYGSHNRVLDRFPGVDGIKTGYINASGFNLVSSVEREGVHIVAVVMGGVTAASRDNHMVSLLKQHYPVLLAQKKSGKEATQFAQNLPKPALKPTMEPIQVAVAQPVSAPVKAPGRRMDGASLDERVLAGNNKAPRPAPSAAITYTPVSAQVAVDGPAVAIAQPAVNSKSPVFDVSFVSSAQAAESKPNTLEYQYALLDTDAAPDTLASSRDWGIQVGAFRSEKQARDALTKAMKTVQNELKDAYLNITSDQQQSASIHRARLGNLSKSEAESACRKLNAVNAACFPLRIN